MPHEAVRARRNERLRRHDAVVGPAQRPRGTRADRRARNPQREELPSELIQPRAPRQAPSQWAAQTLSRNWPNSPPPAPFAGSAARAPNICRNGSSAAV